MLKKSKNTDLRKLARGRNCTFRCPGVCRNNRDTVVLCHTNEHRAARAGMGIKPPDLLAFYACSACHDAADGRKHPVPDGNGCVYTNDEIRVMEYQAVIRTLRMLIDEGLIEGDR